MPNGYPADSEGAHPDSGPTVFSGEFGSIYDLGWAHGPAVATGGFGGTVTDSELATLRSAFVAQYGRTWLGDWIPYTTTTPIVAQSQYLTTAAHQASIRATLLAEHEEQQALIESQWWLNTTLSAASGATLGLAGTLAKLIWGETRSQGHGENESAFLLGGGALTAASLGMTGIVSGAGVTGGQAVTTATIVGAPRSVVGTVLRFFHDPRSFAQISRTYWATRGGAAGRSLHHWLIPQRATWVPASIRNAGFNLLDMPGLVGWTHRSLSVNSWMGFASRWGPTAAGQAAKVEILVRLFVPAAGAAAGSAGYAVGSMAAGE